MANVPTSVELARSLRAPLPGSTELGDADLTQVITVSVHLRSSKPQLRRKRVAELTLQKPHERQHLSRSELAQLHGSAQKDIDLVKAFAIRHGLTIEETSSDRRMVRLRGSVGALAAAFETKVKRFAHPTGEYRARTVPIHLPPELNGVVEAVLGFDTRRRANPHVRIAPRDPGGTSAATDGFTPPALASIYGFPPASGAGEVIGIIELSAPKGSGYRLSDLTTYFQSIGVPVPSITAVSVDGGVNDPGTDPNDQDNADGEVMLDIEVAGSIAPGAAIVVYFAPNTAQGFADVIKYAVYDNDHRPTVLSLSWGGAEDPTDSSYDQIDEALQDAVQLGVTVCVASGDSGSHDDGNNPAAAAVDFPASHPNALGCGGTSLRVKGTSIADETTWAGSGGGVSRMFALPTYQSSAGVPPAKNPVGPVMRGVPDVSGDADPVDRLPGPGRREQRRLRGNQRGRASLGGSGRTPQPTSRSHGGVPQSDPLCKSPLHARRDLWVKRRLFGQGRVGSLHRAGNAERRGAVEHLEVNATPPCAPAVVLGHQISTGDTRWRRRA